MKNIAIVTRSMQSGGAERVISLLANYWADKKLKCSIIMVGKYEVFYKLDKRISLYGIEKKAKNSFIDRALRYIAVRKLIKELKPDIVLTMPEDIGVYVIPALIGTGIKTVVSERNNPWVMPYTKSGRACRKLFYPFASGYIFQTKMAASFFSDKIQNKGIVLPNPVDLNILPQRYKGIRRKEIVAVGRFEKQKNFGLLIKAFAEFYRTHTEYKLIIYGEGKLRPELEGLAKELLPNSAYSLPGRDNKWHEKSVDSSMLVLSSDYEGMPNVVIEAMAMGLPVISTDCPSGGSAELIADGENGLLVPVNDIHAMVKAMNCIADDDGKAEKFSVNALRIRDELQSDKVIKKWTEYMNTVYEND